MSRTRQGTRVIVCIGAMLAIVARGALGPIEAAGASAASRCAAAKMKAAGKKVYGKAKCHQRALLADAPVDAACVAKVESKFAAAIASADLLGLCPGTAAGLETDVDACVASLVAGVATTTPTASTTSTTLAATVEVCCQGTSFCTQIMAATPGDCSALGTAVAGPAGSACDGTTGTCVPAPAPGPCCQSDLGFCLAGPSFDAENCTSLGATFFAAATCTPSGCIP